MAARHNEWDMVPESQIKVSENYRKQNLTK